MNSIAEKVHISSVDMAERRDIDISTGDTVRVWIKLEEKGKEGKIRLQAFEGIVLARKHGNEPGATFTVRRVTGGLGVEKIFPLYSTSIDKIEILRRVKTRRAKLYHIREKAAREIKRQMRKMKLVQIATKSEELRKKEAIEKQEAEAHKKEETEMKAKQAEEREKVAEKLKQDKQSEKKEKEEVKLEESSAEKRNEKD